MNFKLINFMPPPPRAALILKKREADCWSVGALAGQAVRLFFLIVTNLVQWLC